MSVDLISLCFRLEEAAVEIRRCTRNSLYVAFAKHLLKVVTAARALEKVLDCSDSEIPVAEAAIRDVLSPTAEIESVTEEAKIVLKDLEDALKRVDK